jgi:hypothetical protein
MPSANRIPVFEPNRRKGELIEIRRDYVLLARSLTRGPERNQMRQIALSLRASLKSGAWLDASELQS